MPEARAAMQRLLVVLESTPLDADERPLIEAEYFRSVIAVEGSLRAHLEAENAELTAATDRLLGMTRECYQTMKELVRWLRSSGSERELLGKALATALPQTVEKLKTTITQEEERVLEATG